MSPLAYRAGEPWQGGLVWASLLPQVGRGVVPAWVTGVAPPGAWVVDPLVAHPALTVEVARAGYRVLAVTGNPVLRFLVEHLAVPLEGTALRATLAALAGTRKGDRRLEQALRSLYTTPCPRCQGAAEAEAYLWQREPERLLRRVIRCPRCGWQGEAEPAPEDLEQAERLARAAPMHRARLAERVVPPEHPLREAVERVVAAFPPRALEVLTALLARRADPAVAPQQTAFDALFLAVLEAALPVEGETRRPLRHLARPARYWERNLWAALEAAPSRWRDRGAVPCVTWPRYPPERGGITLWPGRVRQAGDALRRVTPQAVFFVLPRPFPTFWALSALAAAWLWGREAVSGLLPLLARRRYDGPWMAAAWAAALRPLARVLPETTPVWAWLPEADDVMLAALGVAVAQAGWQVLEAAPQPTTAEAQLLLQPAPTPIHSPRPAFLRQVLRQRNTPTPRLTLLTAALVALPPASEKEPGAAFYALQEQWGHACAALLPSDKRHATPFTLADTFVPPKDPAAPPPLDDRVEELVLSLLRRQERWSETALYQAVYEALPGWLTPEAEWVEQVLRSYARPVTEGWQLRPRERARRRAADLARVRAAIRSLGQRLGFHVAGDLPLRWLHADGREVVRFYPSVLARGEPLLREPPPAEAVLVLPASRASLWLCKVRRDPRLQAALRSGRWAAMKFRHILTLAQRVQRWEDWLALRDADPFGDQPVQPPLWSP